MGKRSGGNKGLPNYEPGTSVLLGSCRASYPSDWYLGEVLASADGDLFIRRFTMNGKTWRETAHVTAVRAAGTISDLVTIQRQAADAVREHQQAIRDAEQALGDARGALFAKLEKLSEGGLAIIPPDFAAIKGAYRADRAAVEDFEAERLNLGDLPSAVREFA